MKRPAQRFAPILGILLLVSLSSVCVALLSGPHSVDWSAWPNLDDTSRTVLFELRWPRALAAFCCGGLLALAGALLQALLRNPLAEPGVLGVSGGASLGALWALWLGTGTWASHSGPTLGAALGALCALAILLVFSARSVLATYHDTQAPVRVLLTGVMIATACGAGTSLLLSLAPETDLRGMLFWLLGDLSSVQTPGWIGLAWLFIGGYALTLARDLNLAALGDLQALALGVSLRRLRLEVLILAALATAAAVTIGGAIGFVGLIVPHLLRRWCQNDQRVLLPACWLGGGAFLVFADTLARTTFTPLQLPVGVMTAFIGVPVFLWILAHARR